MKNKQFITSRLKNRELAFAFLCEPFAPLCVPVFADHRGERKGAQGGRKGTQRIFATAITFVCIVFVFFGAAAGTSAQTNFADKIVVDLQNGGAVSFEPQMSALSDGEPLLSAALLLGASNLKQQAVRSESGLERILYDEANGVLFGYRLLIKPTSPLQHPAGKNFQIVFEPLAETSVRASYEKLFPGNLSGKSKFRFLTIPAPPPQTLADGDTLALDLLVSQQLGLKITDRVRVVADKRALETVPVRDFTLDELELAAAGSKLIYKDQIFALGSPTRDYQGSLLWFYLPEKGFVAVSLAPRDGYDFRKIGVLQNDRINFRLDGESYEWTSDKPFLRAEGAWHLWVLFVRGYAPPAVALAGSFDKTGRKSFIQNEPFWRSGSRSLTNYVLDLSKFAVRLFNYGSKSKTADNSFRNPPRLVTGAAKTLDSLLPKN